MNLPVVKDLKVLVLVSLFLFAVQPVSAADVVFTCAADGIGDQDDMCLWLHPEDPAKSLIITADKDAWKLFVYNLQGEELGTYPLPHRPGNIDVVYNFSFNGRLIDLVGFNTRSVNNARFGFYMINEATLELDSLGFPRTDGWNDELYGCALYRSPVNQSFYAFGSDQSSRIQQYHFFDDGNGGIAVELKRSWQNGSAFFPTEGMVADHENGLLYAANENEGIYVYDAEEDQPTGHIRFLGLDPGKLDDDVEGVAIYYAANGSGYLIASSQGENYFSVFERAGDNAFVGTFQINGVRDTDGIDVLSSTLDENFPAGIFACHNDRLEPQHVELVSWEDISNDFEENLIIDTTYWNPRLGTTTSKDFEFDHTQLEIYPNPASSLININFEVNRPASVQCLIYDANGREIARLNDQDHIAGKFHLTWESPSAVPQGLVYCKVLIGEQAIVRKVIII